MNEEDIDPEYYGFDTETDLIADRNIIPTLVCFAMSDGEGTDSLSVRAEKEDLDATLDHAFDKFSTHHLVAHNASFDLGVVARYRPRLIPHIFSMLKQGRIHCTVIREKLLHLADHGQIDFILRRGKASALLYDLASVLKRRTGLDISATKGPDTWRTAYVELIDTPLDEWPEDAVSYAMDDAVHCLSAFADQDEQCMDLEEELGCDPLAVEAFRVRTDFCLQLATARGICLRPDVLAEVEEFLTKELDPEKLPLLHSTEIWDEFDQDVYVIETFDPRTEQNVVEEVKIPRNDTILQPAMPAMPFANGAKDHLESCPKHKDHPEHKKGKHECDCPIKMTQPKAEKLNKKVFEAYVMALSCTHSGVELSRNDLTDKQKDAGQLLGNVSVGTEWMEEYHGASDVLEQFRARQKIIKLVTSYLPKFYRHIEIEGEEEPIRQVVDTVHFPFDVLKRTGRTSSSGSDKYPSMNGQQMDPRVRKIFRPREGYLFASFDFKAMELCTAAQVCLDLFGESVLADKINAGDDTHTYLGAQIANHIDPGFMHDVGSKDQDAAYSLLTELSDIDEPCEYPWADEYIVENPDDDRPTYKKFYKHFRTFAKPTGLGYPGGLGPDTFMVFAKANYGVTVDLPTATLLKKVWLNTYPEFVHYFEYIKKELVDYRNGGSIYITKDGEERKSNRYVTTTPLGMVRSACNFCPAANGTALQAPSAEGALSGFDQIVEATLNPDLNSPLLYDSRGYVFAVNNFIHDEIFGELRDEGPKKNMERVTEVCSIMEEHFMEVTPDVKSTAEPALMRTCWIKAAETEIDENGYIIPWDDVESNRKYAEKEDLI